MANHPSAEHLLSLLHDGDRCLAEARLSLQRSHKLLDIFRQEGQRLFHALSLLSAQVDSLTSLLHWVWSSTNAFAARLESLLMLLEGPFHTIASVCQELRQTQVDPELVAGEHGHTLFDFIDDASLSSLRTQAEGDLKEMWVWHERGVRTQTGMEERVLYLQQALSTTREEAGLTEEKAEEEKEEGKRGEKRFENTWLCHVMEGNVAEQAAIIERMKASLLEAASAYYRLSRTSHRQQPLNSPSPPSTLSSPPLRSPATDERELLRLLQSGIDRMKALHLQMEHQLPSILHALRQSLVQLANDDLLTIMQEAQTSVGGLKEGQMRFGVLGEEVQGAVGEIASLASFYSQFLKAYGRLRPEVARRRRGLSEMEQVVEGMEERLRRRQEEEERERARFWEECGRFLPQSLCPLIQEPAETFTVVPRVRDLLGRMPMLGEEIGREAGKDGREESGGGR